MPCLVLYMSRQLVNRVTGLAGGLTERGSAIISDFALKWLEIHPKLRSQLLIFYIIILQLLLKF